MPLVGRQITFGKCPVTVAFDYDGNTQVIWCGKWTCPHCQQTLAAKWAVRARQAFKPDQDGVIAELWFLTLTLGPFYRKPEQGFAALPHLWDRVRQDYRRKHGDFLYMAFVEGQPERGGTPHFHILTDAPPPIPPGKRKLITKHALHDWAMARGFGFETELELVTSKKATEYVAKYASKQHPAIPKGFRRVRCSRAWPPLPDLDPHLVIMPHPGETVSRYCSRVSAHTGIMFSALRQAYEQMFTEPLTDVEHSATLPVA